VISMFILIISLRGGREAEGVVGAQETSQTA
jgi:hypothetical protein